MAALMLNRRLRARVRSERGAEIIEFAMVTPIFALLIAAMFDFGFLFRNWEIVTNAAREGARVGVLPSYSCAATSVDVKDRVDAYMAGSGISKTASPYTVSPQVTTVTTAAGTFSACVVKISMTQTLPVLKVFTTWFGSNLANINLQAAAVMRTETQAAN
jgi:Flp pilus assembly protein TadG